MEKERLFAAQAKNISNKIIDQKKEHEIKLQLKSKYYFDLVDEIFNAALAGKKKITKQFNYDDFVEFSALKLLDRDFEIDAKKDGNNLQNQISLIEKEIFDIYEKSELICENISAEILDILELHPEYIENNYLEFDGYLSYPEIDFDTFYDSISYINQSGYEWINDEYFKHYDIVKNAIELDFLNWSGLTIKWQKQLQNLLLLLFNNIEERNNKVKILAQEWASIYKILDSDLFVMQEIDKDYLRNFEKNEAIILDIFWGNEILENDDGFGGADKEMVDYLYSMNDFDCSVNMAWISSDHGQKIIEEIEKLIHESSNSGLLFIQFNLLPPNEENEYWSFFPTQSEDNVVQTTLTNPAIICDIFKKLGYKAQISFPSNFDESNILNLTEPILVDINWS